MIETTAEIFANWAKCEAEIDTHDGYARAFELASYLDFPFWMETALDAASTRDVDADFVVAVKTYAADGVDEECKHLCAVWLARHAIAMVIKGASK